MMAGCDGNELSTAAERPFDQLYSVLDCAGLGGGDRSTCVCDEADDNDDNLSTVAA